MPRKTGEDISRFYDGIFHCYDAANRALTLGMDSGWRARAAKAALRNSPASCLDVCTGTGEMALLLKELSPGAEITAVDMNERMLSAARKKAAGIRFIRGEAARLPFPDGSFDALTAAFAARNLDCEGELAEIFREFRRVLKPGGVFVNLETSQPRNPVIKRLFHLYVRIMTALAGVFVPEERQAYAFLSDTVRSFYGPDELTRILSDAGFTEVEAIPLNFSSIAVHRAVKRAAT